MQCMKCGRDLEAGEVFCSECRENMKKYPVKPGTVVQLPYRSGESAVKKQAPRRRTMPPEEQLVLLKRMIRRLVLTVVVLILFSAGACYFAVAQYLENKNKQAVGQNYYVSTTVPETTDNSDPTEQ